MYGKRTGAMVLLKTAVELLTASIGAVAVAAPSFAAASLSTRTAEVPLQTVDPRQPLSLPRHRNFCRLLAQTNSFKELDAFDSLQITASSFQVAQHIHSTTSAIFSASPVSGAAPLLVRFLIRPPSGSFTSYYVDFGDGQAGNPSLVSSDPLLYATQHIYASQGSYTAVAGAQICSPSGEKCSPIVFSELKISVSRHH